MPTYVFQCKKCKIDWLKSYKMSEVPRVLVCAECGSDMRQRVSGGLGVIFKDGGFPGNDMKGLHDGKSSGTTGRKPTSKELDYVEKQYPGSNDSTKEKVEKIIDGAKSGSKKDALYSASKRTR